SETETGSYETESTESVTGSSSDASEDQFEFSVTNEPSEREKAGKCSATSDETSSVDVSLSEYTTENCCIHGKPCIIGQGESEVTSTSSRKVPEYEPVKLDVLQNPPESYSRRSRREEPPKKGMVYMLQRPPDMTSSGFYTSRSPSKTSKSNHLYENMDTLNN
uniref:Uncharacterized protein n=1 Tax=Panagrolaimus sp. JU765 TaxID=591449 RepID=A0AC34R281_9BILA